jgi:uncharacterized protein (TIGR03066 family)
MQQLRYLAVPLVLVMALTALAEEKKEKASLVGTWEAVKGSETLPVGATLEFTNDGKITVTVKQGDKTQVLKGTYKLDGESLKVVLKAGDKEHAETMKTKLTAKELVTIDEMGKKDILKKTK